LYHDLPQDLRHDDNCEKLGEIFSIMSRLTEIQKAIEELAPEEKEELRDWLDGYDPATERECAAIAQERIRQIESGEVAPLDGEQVLKEMRQLG
jgi:DNA-directed RNA polymerase sigma subunit (sigma70/sigma32)